MTAVSERSKYRNQAVPIVGREALLRPSGEVSSEVVPAASFISTASSTDKWGWAAPSDWKLVCVVENTPAPACINDFSKLVLLTGRIRHALAEVSATNDGLLQERAFVVDFWEPLPAVQQVTGRATQPQMSAADWIAFRSYYEEWKKERGTSSSLDHYFSRPAYLKILAMGARALPMIFFELRQSRGDPDHWYNALEVITGDNPVDPDDLGDTVAMAETWIEWARRHGW